MATYGVENIINEQLSLIKKYFENNKKLEITGYDHVSFNNSIECDISNYQKYQQILLIPLVFQFHLITLHGLIF